VTHSIRCNHGWNRGAWFVLEEGDWYMKPVKVEYMKIVVRWRENRKSTLRVGSGNEKRRKIMRGGKKRMMNNIRSLKKI